MIRSLFRRALVLLSGLMLMASCSTTPTTLPIVLTGRIMHPLDSVLTFTRFRNPVSYIEDSVRVRLAADGTFRLTLDTLTRPTELVLLHGRHRFQLFLEPGDSLGLTMDGQQPEKTLRYAGRGNGINNYLAELDRQGLANGFYGTPLVQGITHADTLRRRADNFRRQCQQVLRTATAKAPLSAAARQYARFSTDYDWAYCLLSLPDVYSYEGQPLAGITPSYYRFLEQLPTPQDSALAVAKYGGFLSSYVMYCAKQKQPTVEFGTPNGDSAYFAAANTALGTSRSRDVALASHVYEKLSVISLKEAAPLVAEFQRLSHDSTLSRLIRTEYTNRRKLAPGQPAPAFTLADSSGHTVSLSSLRGKVVYLDLWATWCGPCLKEMQAAPQLYKALAGREVAFVAVSLDEDEAAWRKWLRRHAAPGVLYLHANGMNAPIAQAYQVQGIPSYWLIGPDGRIVDSAPPRPSELQKARQAIEAALPNRTAVARR